MKPQISGKDLDVVLRALGQYKQGLSGEGDIAQVDDISVSLRKYQHIPFRAATSKILADAGFELRSLILLSEKIPEIRKLGLQNSEGISSLTLEQTKRLISAIRAHVSFSTEAGCRILVNAVLLHVVSNISSIDVNVSIIAEFRMQETIFPYASTSYGGVVDFLIVKGPSASTDLLLVAPQHAFDDPNTVKVLSSTIYEAKKQSLKDAVPQAAIACASYCVKHSLSAFRGCVTNGEIWMFFVVNMTGSGDGGVDSISEEFQLEKDLPFVLGLLSDWINNSKDKAQKFFKYSDIKQ